MDGGGGQVRDLRKIKSKYEFKLDNKQIAFLFVGGLVILVVVFALGIVVGKGLVEIQGAENVAMQETPVTAETIPDPIIWTEPTPEATPEASDSGYVNILTATPDPGTETVPEATPEPMVPDTIVPEPTPAPTPEPIVTPPSSTGGKFTIQLSSHPTKADADTRKALYLSKGLADVYVMSAKVKGQTWYRVRTGHFATKEGAQQFAGAIKAKGIVANPWVTTK
jgi:septal ring-binding cell division protein DamX